MCSLTVGAESFSVVNLEEAANKINEAYEKHGKPVDVIANSHGHPGRATFFDSNMGDVEKFIAATQGKVHEFYVAACLTGGEAEASARKGHIMRRLALGLRAPVVGVDRVLMLTAGSKTGKFHIGGGNRVTITPNVPEQLFEPAAEEY